ncbi:MAG TPA: helix-turn-helix domain-containing protein [Amycolatopsis sp.]|nr:helix-turn-helix domain-containing protein [Amycolatopsis sp.]
MTRLTRAEQQQRTHSALLDAGRRVFLRRGFLAASVEEIAAEAGYTRGAVYKHFGSKEGLWLTLLEAGADAFFAELQKNLSGARTRDELIAALSPRDSRDSLSWSTTAAEVLAASAQQPEINARIAAVQQRFDDRMAELLATHAARLGLTPALPLSEVVVMLGALGIGLALRHTVAPAGNPTVITAHVLGSVFPAE